MVQSPGVAWYKRTMEHDTDTLPTDYEPCGTCGYDHAYDLPNLSPGELHDALEAHEEV